MERELAEIGDDGAALVFGAGCLRAVLFLAIAERLRSVGAATLGILLPLTLSTWRLLIMNLISARPRLIGLICGAGAVAMGMAYMLAGGAPSSYLLVNFAALVLGATAWLALGRATGSRLAAAGPVILALAVALLGTALFGVAADGVRRWVSVGPLGLQVSLILLPIMLVLYARRTDAIGTAGMIVAAAALALQPDRAMAGVLAAGLVALLIARRSLPVGAAAAAAVPAFGWTLLRPDASPAMPYVDGILYSAFEVHVLAGLAVAIGAFSLTMPALIGRSETEADRAVLFAFGACWAAVVVAAGLGNYPTPLVGYGGSAVLGYLLSVALLPGGARAGSFAGVAASPSAASRSSDISSELRIAGAA